MRRMRSTKSVYITVRLASESSSTSWMNCRMEVVRILGQIELVAVRARCDEIFPRSKHLRRASRNMPSRGESDIVEPLSEVVVDKFHLNSFQKSNGSQ